MGSPQCYVKINNAVVANNWKICGKQSDPTQNLQCCADGDFCLSNGLCQYSHSELGASGYYAGGCTSQDYRDSSCPQLCNSQGKKDVVFDSRQRVWSCCGGDASSPPRCDAPTNDNFGAPGTNQLITIYQAGVGMVTSPVSNATDQNRTGPGPPPPPSSAVAPPTVTTPTSTTPHVVVVTKNPTPGDNASTRISAALAGGVGAGAAVAVLLISGILFFLWRRKSKAKKRSPRGPIPPSASSTGKTSFTRSGSRVRAFRAMAHVRPDEIRAKVIRHEMSPESVMVAELAAGDEGTRREGERRMSGIQEMEAAGAVRKEEEGGKGS
ncbi:hypothetical protein FKW77_001607 [Venturia effusa]|uniref:Uncharacterized protein n=1 Tax=Venturia effusa TaxID=50376 RepID=A0A517LM90_9PEZI|nr:hypothetical protein FKW77_001607 [Venturia effusa]